MTSYQLFANMLWLKFVHPSVSAYSPMDLMGLCFSDLTPPSADNSLATTADENGGGMPPPIIRRPNVVTDPQAVGAQP